jgi:hypothetical protein
LFSRNLTKNSVRADNIGDLDKALRLREFLLGHADSRKETQHVITLGEMQERHKQARERAAELDPAESGMVIETEGKGLHLLDTPHAPHASTSDEGEEGIPPAADFDETRQQRIEVARKDSANRPPFDPLSANASCRVAQQSNDDDNGGTSSSALKSTDHAAA